MIPETITRQAQLKAKAPRKSSPLVEVFSAIQGEGPIVGCRQLFVRYLGCHIQCAYCDTPATHTKQRQCRLEQTPGLRDFVTLANPVPHSELIARLLELESLPGLHHSVSLTGGEPLQHVHSLRDLLPQLKAHFQVYLETDGILVDQLEMLVDSFDMIGMDVKIPSATQLQPYWEEHRRFIRIAARRDLFVKAVLTAHTTPEELDQLMGLVSEVDRQIPVILQPVTPYGAVRKVPSPEQMLNWQARLKAGLNDVRVIPQTHKMMGQI